MKIVWLSVSPWAPTGYGDQTALFVPRIKAAGHDIAISCQHGVQYTELSWDGVPVYPQDYTGMNKIVLRSHVEEHGRGEPVKVISLYDIWPWVDPMYGGIVADFQGLDIAAWVPIDTLGVPPKTMGAILDYQVRPIAMSQHGETQLREAGLDPLYVPHGIDTTILRPIDERDECRKALGLPADAFVIGVVAHNSGITPCRKGFPEMLQAFKIFRDSHDDAFLYLHTDVSGRLDNGLNLLGHAGLVGITADALCAVNQVSYLRGIPKRVMPYIYSGMDVLLNTSWGEGFGIPIVEAQACGVPVITTHFTSMPELTGAGWTVGGQPWRNPASGGIWMHPNVEEIVAALELAYENRDNQELKSQAREFALQYDADRVMSEYWLPVLDELSRPREVPPLKPNRAMRRKMAKAA